MSNFRVNKPLSNMDSNKKQDIKNFTKGADNHSIDITTLDRAARPTRSFTVPMNEYELNLLKQIAENEDRSQRYISRKLLLKAMEQELKINSQ
jgi:hypothetical protein